MWKLLFIETFAIFAALMDVYNGIQYRLFAFWDTEKDTLVVATYGIIKKVWKVPSKEIAKAEEIRKKYFETK